MNDDATAAILDRLGRLERSNRLLRTVTMLFAALAVVGVLTAQTAGPTVVGNPSGARTTISPQGVMVYDASGTVRLDMTLNGQTPTFSIYGPDGKMVLQESDTKNGGFVHINDNAGTTRLATGVFDDGLGGFNLYRGTSQFAVALNDDPTGSYLSIYDAKGVRRSFIGNFRTVAGMEIYSAAGKTVITASDNATGGGGFFRANDDNGNRRGSLGYYDDGSTGLSLYNAGGTVTFKAP